MLLLDVIVLYFMTLAKHDTRFHNLGFLFSFLRVAFSVSGNGKSYNKEFFWRENEQHM